MEREQNLSQRIFGMYDHLDGAQVALREIVPHPSFEYQRDFLNETVRLLRESGREVFLSSATTAIGPEAYVKVPVIVDRKPGLNNKLRRVAFRILDSFCGAPSDIRNLGAILYQLGDEWGDVDDLQVKDALKQASESCPHQHTPRMPLGTPIR